MSTTPSLPISPSLAEVLDIVRGAGLPAMLVGEHGIGKSEFLMDYARQRGIAAKTLDLSLLEAPDLTGLPYRDGDRTRFAPPATLPASDHDGPTMLVLEELNRCDRSVRQPCLQLLTTRRLNDYELPEGCFLVACVNPDDAAYDVDALDPALASRFAVLRVRSDPGSWTRWADEAGVYPPIVDFVRQYPQAFDQAPPRTWTYAAQLLREGTARGKSRAQIEAALHGVLSRVTARGLLQELTSSTPAVPPQELLATPLRFQGLFESWIAQHRHDLIGVVLDTAVRHLQHPEVEIDAGAVNRKELEELLAEVPPDLSLRLLRAVDLRLAAPDGP